MAMLQLIQQISPGLLIAAGVALLIVPRFIRWIIALGLIFLGLAQLYPDTFTGVPTN